MMNPDGSITWNQEFAFTKVLEANAKPNVNILENELHVSVQSRPTAPNAEVS